jgi:hypothetical protein
MTSADSFIAQLPVTFLYRYIPVSACIILLAIAVIVAPRIEAD